jgi:glycosyltransferase involved in cell wall biosynthesis
MQVSLIATVLNEGDSMRGLLDSIAAQTRPPDEVIICDGGSTDNTLAVIAEYADRLPLWVIEWPGANISQGRNAAIEAATGDLIAATDAGVWLDPEWLAYLLAPFADDPALQVVSGFFLPDPQMPFEVAMGATVLPELRDVDPATFMPSSRSVAYRREAWEQVGGYPEWLDFCEDLVFDFRLLAAVGPFGFAPDAVVYFRPRPTLRDFVRQYRQYARGDGKANLFFRRHLIRYMTYLVALPLFLFAGAAVSPWWLLVPVAGAVYMVWTPYRRLLRQWGGLSPVEKLVAGFWVPVIRVAGDVAKMAGYPAGVAWRVRHRPPNWRLDSSRSDRMAR